MNKVPLVFFDIGNTLGSPKISPPPYHLESLNIYPYIPGILQQLKSDDLRLGTISNTGNETESSMKKVLETSGIYNFFEPDLPIYSSVVGVSKPDREIFRLAATKAGNGNTPANCLFVGEDSKERKAAQDEGWQVVPHPCLVVDVLNGSRLRYICVTVSAAQNEQAWRSAMRNLAIAPLYVTGENGTKVYVIASTSAITKLDDLGFQVDRLGSEGDPLTTTVYLLRDDRQTSTGFLNPQGQSSHFFGGDEESKWVLASAPEGLYIALPGDRSVEADHFEDAHHGHNLKLLPDLSLLEPFGEGKNARTADFVQASLVEPSLSDLEVTKFTTITPDSIRGYLERYAGIKPLDGATGIKLNSRHIQSPEIVLFNAEEHGLVGSQAYAKNQAAIAAPIVGVYQMDEDFFAGPLPTSPTAEPNPNYHKEQDTFVDFDYAADIARLVGAAAWLTANL